jgi:PPM family protein phosphatase
LWLVGAESAFVLGCSASTVSRGCTFIVKNKGLMIIRAGIELGNLTDTGCTREDNQDFYCYAEPEGEEEFERKGRLLVVADGMGGHEGGEVASGIAVEVVRERYAGSAANDPEQALMEAMEAAHQAVRGFAQKHPELTGMGTTCTAAVLRNGHLYYGHVGDSRLYLIRDSGITKLTRDHTMVERMVEQGLLGAEEAKAHPQRHVLTEAMGVAEAMAVDFPQDPIALRAGDILLLCTDGLHDLVSDEELSIAARRADPGTACKQLITLAKERGGPDNITVQIVKVAE